MHELLEKVESWLGLVRVIKYDVWGNKDDGFEVNDEFDKTGWIACRESLIQDYFGNPESLELDEFGDFWGWELVEAATGKPLGRIEFDSAN